MDLFKVKSKITWNVHGIPRSVHGHSVAQISFLGLNFYFDKSPRKVHGNPWNPPNSMDSIR